MLAQRYPRVNIARCSRPSENEFHVVRGNIDIAAHLSDDRVALLGVQPTDGRVDEMSDDAAYYRADAQGLNPGDATTRTLDPMDGKEYTYATTRLDLARGIAARHADFAVYSVTLDEPIEADPDAVRDNLGEVFVRAPWGAVVSVLD